MGGNMESMGILVETNTSLQQIFHPLLGNTVTALIIVFIGDQYVRSVDEMANLANAVPEARPPVYKGR